MSELELLADCLKDATKERDELAVALEQKDETIHAMESVLAHIGKRVSVPPGDVPALLEAIDQLTAGDTVTVAAVDVATDRIEHEIEGWNGDQTVPDQGKDDG
ncbi:MAG TPA: hypothetical protein ENH62_14695 [Marinobacter sp.]|uniref:Uncharacterized protein n=1 Tax=marine sediment metagenome TaxID=412755 RepID=A0A0F9NUI1_9ZZZZ|nr:hypothetical protein [Marinobacter sp.]